MTGVGIRLAGSLLKIRDIPLRSHGVLNLNVGLTARQVPIAGLVQILVAEAGIRDTHLLGTGWQHRRGSFPQTRQHLQSLDSQATADG